MQATIDYFPHRCCHNTCLPDQRTYQVIIILGFRAAKGNSHIPLSGKPVLYTLTGSIFEAIRLFAQASFSPGRLHAIDGYLSICIKTLKTNSGT